jgi:methyltransferase (TIGR00027 family)
MLKLFSKEKPSKTAYNAAWFRACSHKDFQDQIWGPDFIAEGFLSFPIKLLNISKKFREKGKAKTNESTPGVYEYIIARTLFFDEVFTQALKESIPQIVFLGAGYDSRGIRFKHLNNSTQIIELDMAATQNRKIKCLKKNKIKIPEYLTFTTIDFNNQSLESALTSAGYQKGKRTLFIWEGVCMYLEAQSVRDTLTFIQQSSTSDSLLAFDCVVSFSDKDGHKYHGAKEMSQFMKDKHKNEPFTFSIDGKNIADFLGECGHKIVRHLNQDQIETTYLKKADGSSIGKPNGLFNMIITSPEV